MSDDDELGLFYQQFQTKTLQSKGERCAGGKLSNVRLTGLAAANAIRENLPLILIGKSAKPRCFNGVKSLPWLCQSQKKAWMNSEIFETYVRKVDMRFQREDRKVVLIIDKCQALPHVENPKALELVFLPPNTASRTQPINQGVIRPLKAYYRSKVIKRQLKFIDACKEEIVSFNILDAMRMLVESLETVISVICCILKHVYKARYMI